MKFWKHDRDCFAELNKAWIQKKIQIWRYNRIVGPLQAKNTHIQVAGSKFRQCVDQHDNHMTFASFFSDICQGKLYNLDYSYITFWVTCRSKIASESWQMLTQLERHWHWQSREWELPRPKKKRPSLIIDKTHLRIDNFQLQKISFPKSSEMR